MMGPVGLMLDEQARMISAWLMATTLESVHTRR
jgi:hypothetical protein